MRQSVLSSMEECNAFLRQNCFLVNGKNHPVTHLYATSEQSRWGYENLWGVYFTKSNYAWMALWMAVMSRAVLRKRQILYYTPDHAAGDSIGRIAVSTPSQALAESALGEQAYLYCFDPRRFLGMPMYRVSHEPKDAKVAALGRLGFQQRTVHARGKVYDALIGGTGPALVDIDAWQVALVGREEVYPDVEVTIQPLLIQALRQRVQWRSDEVGEEYIVPIAEPHS